MKKVTQRDIHDTIVGLRQTAKDLRETASTAPLPDYATPTVPASVSGLIAQATFLEQTADELRLLIAPTPPKVPKN